MDKTETRELISALADGQLQGADFARAVEAASADAAARAAWHDYHLIGDVLRSGDHARASAPEAFLGRFQQRLRQEAAPLESLRTAVAMNATASLPAIQTREPASNDAELRWKLAAGFASVAAVAALGWNLAGTPSSQVQPQLAAVPATALPVAAGPGTLAGANTGTTSVMIRDPHLDQLLAAHRQLGGATALQAPAGFLRNATFEGPAR